MNFLNPFMMWGMFAVAVPILIHLLQRKKVVQVPFSTLRFLKQISSKTTRRSRVENLLLLLLRCAIFALIILAATQPIVSAKASRFLGGNVPRTVVLIVDNSLSMGYKAGEQTRLEVAKKQGAVVLDDLKPDDEVAILAASDHAQGVIAEPTVDHNLARKALQAIQQTEARTDFSPSFREVRRIMKNSKKGIKQLYMFTDNQESGWRFEPKSVFDETWKGSNIKTLVIRPDDIGAVNAAVKRVDFKVPFASAGAMVRGVAVVENYSASAFNDVLEVKVGDEVVAKKPVDAQPNSQVEIPFEFTASEITVGALQGVAKLSGDNLPGDDRAYFSLPVYRPPRVLIVESQQMGKPQEHAGFYLKTALTVGRGAKVAESTVNVISMAELDSKVLDSYSVVFLTDLPRFTDNVKVRLDRFLKSGRTVVLFMGELANIEQLSQLDFLPAKPTKKYDLPAETIRTRITQPDHPIVATAWSADEQMPPLPVQRCFEWEVKKEARTLITIAGRIPFLIVGESGEGKVVVVNGSADLTWGRFPLMGNVFLPLVEQITRWSAEQVARHGSYFVGEPLAPSPSVPHDQALTIAMPGGGTVNLGPGNHPTLIDRLERVGFYTVTAQTDGPVQQFAVNVSPEESNLRPMALDVMNKILPSELVVGMDNLKLWLEQNKGMTRLWPAILLLALLLYLIEGLIANVMARNRSQAEETIIKTGRLNKRRRGQPLRSQVAEAVQ